MNISHRPNVSSFSSSSGQNALRDGNLGLIFIFSSWNTGRKKKYPWVFFFIMVLIKLSALNLVFKEIFHWVSFNIIRRSVDFVGALGRVASPHLPQSKWWYRGMFAFGDPLFLLFQFGLLFQYCLKNTLIVAVQGGRSVKMCLPHHTQSCKCNG